MSAFILSAVLEASEVLVVFPTEIENPSRKRMLSSCSKVLGETAEFDSEKSGARARTCVEASPGPAYRVEVSVRESSHDKEVFIEIRDRDRRVDLQSLKFAGALGEDAWDTIGLVAAALVNTAERRPAVLGTRMPPIGTPLPHTTSTFADPHAEKRVAFEGGALVRSSFLPSSYAFGGYFRVNLFPESALEPRATFAVATYDGPVDVLTSTLSLGVAWMPFRDRVGAGVFADASVNFHRFSATDTSTSDFEYANTFGGAFGALVRVDLGSHFSVVGSASGTYSHPKLRLRLGGVDLPPPEPFGIEGNLGFATRF